MKIAGILIAVINLALLGFLAMSYFKKAEAPPANTVTASTDNSGAGPGSSETGATQAQTTLPEEIYYPLETFIVNLNSPGGQKILKISLEFLLENQEVKTELNTNKAQYRDLLLTILSSKRFDEIDTREGKDILKTEITSTLNPFLKKGRITKVIITDIIYN